MSLKGSVCSSLFSYVLTILLTTACGGGSGGSGGGPADDGNPWGPSGVPPTDNNLLQAKLVGTPDEFSSATTLAVGVDAPTSVQYRYALSSGNAECSSAIYSNWTDASTKMTGDIGPDGPKKLCVIVGGRDSSGRVVVSTLTHSWTKDTVPPSASMTQSMGLGPNVSTGTSMVFSGTAGDALSGLTSVEISVQHGASCLNSGATAFDAPCPLFVATSIAGTAWSYSVAKSLFSAGETYNVQVRATDRAKNIQALPFSLTWDITPPAAPASITVTSGGTRLPMSWSSVSDASSYLIVARRSSPVSYAPNMSQTYTSGMTLGDSQFVAYFGPNLAATVSDLENYSDYYFAAFAVDGAKNVSSSAATTTALSTEEPGFKGVTYAFIWGPGRRVAVEWQPYFDGTTPLAQMHYDVFTSPTSGGQSFGGVPAASVTGTDSVRFVDSGTSDDLYVVVRSRTPDNISDENTREYRLRLGNGYHHKISTTGRYQAADPVSVAKGSTFLRQAFALTADPWGNIVFTGAPGNVHVLCEENSSAEYCKSRSVGKVYTIIGRDGLGDGTSDGLAVNTPVGDIYGIAADSAGNLYLGDLTFTRVRVVCYAPLSTGFCHGKPIGYLYNIAGNGVAGDAADGIVAAESSIGIPYGIGPDSFGNILFGDFSYKRIRVICAGTSGICTGKTKGLVYRLAGTGANADGADAQVAANTGLGDPRAIAVDAKNNIYIADANYRRIRAICFDVSSSAGFCSGKTSGYMYRILGTGASADGATNQVASSAQGIGQPFGIAVDKLENIYISDNTYFRVRSICYNNTGTSVCTGKTVGNVYRIGGTGVTGDGGDGISAVAAPYGAPINVAVDSLNNILLADNTSKRIRAICEDTSGVAGFCVGKNAGFHYQVAGTGASTDGPEWQNGTHVSTGTPQGISKDNAGNIYFSDSTNRRMRVLCYDAAASGPCYGKTVGQVYIVGGSGAAAADAADDVLSIANSMGTPNGVFVDSGGNIFISDNTYFRVRALCLNVSVSGFCSGKTEGNIYRLAGTGATGDGADNAVASATAMGAPSAVVMDAYGNLYVADTSYFRIRVICLNTSGGFCSGKTAGNSYRYSGTGASADGADDSVASSTGLGRPNGMALDSYGNLFATDQTYFRIRAYCNGTQGYCSGKTSGKTYRVVGTGVTGDGSSDVAYASNAIGAPYALSIDTDNNLYVSDAGYGKIRVACVNTNAGYCVGRTLGNMYRFAGTGTLGDAVSNETADSVRLDAMGYGGSMLLGTDHDLLLTGTNGSVRLIVGW